MKFDKVDIALLTGEFVMFSIGLGILVAFFLTVATAACVALITASRSPNPMAQHSPRDEDTTQD